MIYENINLHSVPWEVLAKEFRAEIKGMACASPRAYATAFFDFLRAGRWLFPEAVLDDHTRTQAFFAALSILWNTDGRGQENANVNRAERMAQIRQRFEARRTDLHARPLPQQFSQQEWEAVLERHTGNVAETITGFIRDLEVPTDIPAPELATLGLEAVVKTYQSALKNFMTGLVIAGYGEREAFPSFCEFKCYGFIAGRLLIDNGATAEIDHNTPAAVKAFAQTSMVDTFEMGVSFDIFASARRHFQSAAEDLRRRIAEATGVEAVLNTDDQLRAALEGLTNRWLEEARQTHRAPLHQVIGSLPVNEMADLAETLISLQSLKEKVTKPSESVGGPVDVAVISRSDGLIWVKRKHYFDAEMNPRYFMRQKELYG
jgi:hypothetical protein